MGKPKGYLQERYRELRRETLSGLPEEVLLRGREEGSGKGFTVLGIESSCDDTGVAIVSSTGRILSNVVMSQYKVHEQFGGVVPGLAMEAHRANIDVAIDRALKEAGLASVSDVDAIAVTKGPGLEICLRVGCRKGQQLATEFNKPFVVVHHLEAHCMIARLSGIQITDEVCSSTSVSPVASTETTLPFQPKIEFPFLTFLASGGHTSIMLCKGLGDYEFIGGTLDDALGEAFDKAARILGLHATGNGGAAVEAMAQLYKDKYVKAQMPAHGLRVPMRDKPGFDFSYSGLKSSFRNEVYKFRMLYGLDAESTNAPNQQMQEVSKTISLPEEATAYLCSIFQDTAFGHVEDRLKRAIQYVYSRGIVVNGLVVVGGVAANLELRRRLLNLLETKAGVPMKLIFPPVRLCTDNGAMVAWTGVETLNLGVSNAIADQEVIAKWPLGTPIN